MLGSGPLRHADTKNTVNVDVLVQAAMTEKHSAVVLVRGD
jgi:hypothetical protein